MSPRALFVTDLDGTLLDDDGNLPRVNAEAIDAATARGVAVVIATGRRRSSFRSARERLAGLGFRVSLSNGAVVLGADNEAITDVRDLSWVGVDRILERRHPLVRSVVTITVPPEPAAGAAEEPDAILWEPGAGASFAGLFGDRSTYSPVVPEIARTRRLVHVAMITGSREDGESLFDLARASYGEGVAIHTARSPRLNGTLTEVVPAGGKGNAIEDYARILGVPIAATAGIGDELNDEALLDRAAFRYAVSGSPLAGRRRDATAVATANAGAVADALARFLDEIG
jgi:hypothetical protein